MSLFPALATSRRSHRSAGVPARTRRYRDAVRHLETLEPRTLLSATVTVHNPDPLLAPLVATYASDNSVWVVNPTGIEGDYQPSLARIENGVMAESFTLPASNDLGVDVRSIASDNDGHIFVTDFNGFIYTFDIGAETFAIDTYDVGVDHQFADRGRTAIYSGGALWFIGAGTNNELAAGYHGGSLSMVVRYDLASDTISYGGVSDDVHALSTYLAPRDAGSVYVALQAEQTQVDESTWILGTNAIATVSFSNGALTTTGVHALSLDNDINQWGIITGIAADTDGSLWVSLGNYGTTPVVIADQLLNVRVTDAPVLSTEGQVTLPGGTAPLAVGNLRMDSAGRLWFTELMGTHTGYWDTFNAGATLFENPPATFPVALVTGAGEVSVLLFDGELGGTRVMQIAFPVTFTATAYSQSGVEGVAFEGFLLAEFTAVEGDYTAVITWGDGTTLTVVPIYMGENTYVVMVDSKTFATQGSYDGTVSIRNAAGTELGAPAFQSAITDTPLAIGTVSVANPMGKYAILSLTFTDDIASSASWFSATINWGDHSTSSGVVVKDPTTPGRYLVLGTHKYKKKGTYSILASIATSEADAAVISASATVNVVI